MPIWVKWILKQIFKKLLQFLVFLKNESFIKGEKIYLGASQKIFKAAKESNKSQSILKV